VNGSGGNAGDGSAAPAENRHGGAPRGERPASWDAPRLARHGRRARRRDKGNTALCRRSAQAGTATEWNGPGSAARHFVLQTRGHESGPPQ
jgi:hypothetical protein